MKAYIKFMKMYNKLPDKAKRELVYNFSTNPMSLVVCKEEILQGTKLGEKILLDLGYEGD